MSSSSLICAICAQVTSAVFTELCSGQTSFLIIWYILCTIVHIDGDDNVDERLITIRVTKNGIHDSSDGERDHPIIDEFQNIGGNKNFL